MELIEYHRISLAHFKEFITEEVPMKMVREDNIMFVDLEDWNNCLLCLCSLHVNSHDIDFFIFSCYLLVL